MKKYTLLNTALFRNNIVAPLYKVYDTETKEVYYLATSVGRRGVTLSFTGTRSEVNKWRQSTGMNG